MDKKQLREIEKRHRIYGATSYYETNDDLFRVIAALREACKRRETLTNALKAQASVVYNDGTHCFCNADRNGNYPLQGSEHSEWCRIASTALKEADEAQV